METTLVTTENLGLLPLRSQIWQIRDKSWLDRIWDHNTRQSLAGSCPESALAESVTTQLTLQQFILSSLPLSTLPRFLTSCFRKPASVVDLLVPSSRAMHVTAIISTVAVLYLHLYFVYTFDGCSFQTVATCLKLI